MGESLGNILAIGFSLLASILWSVMAVAVAAGPADLRGHGGPVRAIAANGSGEVLTGSFDTRAIVWDVESGAAKRVLRFHEGSVTAVAFLPDGTIATGGQDGRIAIWDGAGRQPVRVVEAHAGPVAAFAVSPDGRAIASGAWDGTVLLLPLTGEAPMTLKGHSDNVNGTTFLSAGTLATAGYDGTLRIWNRNDGAGSVIKVGVPLNAIAAGHGRQIWTAAADGVIRAHDAQGAPQGQVRASFGPLVALAVRGKLVAAGSLGGTVVLVDAETLTILRTIEASSGPVWSLAFEPESGALLVGGADYVVRPWDPASGASLGDTEEVAPSEEFGDSRGAQVFRMCAACHTLGSDDGNRAGPSLHGIFGRRIASANGYVYSEALSGMDVVWTPETVDRLFEIGPSAMIPGTSMPEQRIANPGDRAVLIDFLRKRTR